MLASTHQEGSVRQLTIVTFNTAANTIIIIMLHVWRPGAELIAARSRLALTLWGVRRKRTERAPPPSPDRLTENKRSDEENRHNIGASR